MITKKIIAKKLENRIFTGEFGAVNKVLRFMRVEVDSFTYLKRDKGVDIYDVKYKVLNNWFNPLLYIFFVLGLVVIGITSILKGVWAILKDLKEELNPEFHTDIIRINVEEIEE